MGIFLSKMSILSKIPSNIVGDVVYGERGEFGPRKQPHLQLFYLYNGDIRVIANGRETAMRGGEAVFLIPGVTYRIYFDPHEPARHGWVDLLTVNQPPAWASKPGGEARTFELTERMRALAEIGIAAPRASPEDEGGLRRAIGQAIVEEALRASGHHENTADAHLPPAVIRAQMSMTQRFADPISLDDIARGAGVSKAHLIRLFRKHLGVTPARRLWEIRVEAGSRLLRETGLQVQEIADRCGFPSPYHFSRLIKQAHGVSPREYRRREWE